MRICTVVNSQSGAASGQLERVTQLASESGSELLTGEGNGSVWNAVQDAIRRGCQRLIVAGGDGTLSKLVNAARSYLSDVEVGILPIGTGNDLARSLGIPLDSLDAAWQVAMEGGSVPIDLAKVAHGESTWLINAATGGFGGTVAVDVAQEEKRRWGAFAYWTTALTGLRDLHEYEVRLELDDEVVQLKAYALGIANGRYVGGGFPLAPRALVNDGLLDVTVTPVLPAMELLAAGLNFMLGREDRPEGMQTYRSSRVRVHSEPDLPFSIDGEPTCTIDATFRVVPASLRIVCDADAPAIG